MQYQRMTVDAGEARTFASIPEFWGVTVRCYDPAYPPLMTLPNGENAHTTIQPVPWCAQLFAAKSARHGNIPNLVLVEEPATPPPPA